MIYTSLDLHESPAKWNLISSKQLSSGSVCLMQCLPDFLVMVIQFIIVTTNKKKRSQLPKSKFSNNSPLPEKPSDMYFAFIWYTQIITYNLYTHMNRFGWKRKQYNFSYKTIKKKKLCWLILRHQLLNCLGKGQEWVHIFVPRPIKRTSLS